MEKLADPVNCFQKYLENPNQSVPLAAIETLIEEIRNSKTGTVAELEHHLKDVIGKLTYYAQKQNSVTAIKSGSELFMRFLTLARHEELVYSDFSDTKEVLVKRGRLFLKRAEGARLKIAEIGQQFIRDGCTILIHSKSRVVMELLLKAASTRKRFSVFVTQSMPNKQGDESYQFLTKHNIPCTVILDSAVGYIMERVDVVLLGAEGVIESGGIINKIGSFQLAVMAKAMNKPVYTAAESFKFLREYHLKQSDLPNKCTYNITDSGHPLVDYTPPSYIDLLFTDLGVLTPSAVSDELIKLYL